MVQTLSSLPLKSRFTSDGVKMFHHQEAMQKLRDGRGMPIVSHVMLTDACQHSCAFCSVATREGNSLTMPIIQGYLEQLVPLGLKSVILSGAGNPPLFRCKETKADFNDAVDLIHGMGLQLGLISNGLPMKDWGGRMSWKTVRPETLDKFTWIRISMSGLDHEEKEVFVPDIDPSKTTLGFSYVYHDIINEPKEENHGKVSTLEDVIDPIQEGDGRVVYGKDRLPWLEEKIGGYVRKHNPTYVRLLPNCLQPSLIPERCKDLQAMADRIDPNIVFVQQKPPKSPNVCYLGYVHPVLNSDSFVYPCDSCVLNVTAKHKFASPWRVCKWDEVGKLYSEPVRSLVDPKKLCPGCVFNTSNELLENVRNGTIDTTPSETVPTHVNFV